MTTYTHKEYYHEWQKITSVIIGGKTAKRAYLQALYVLRNEFLPVAYLRSEPIARFESQLAYQIRRIEDYEAERDNRDGVLPKPTY